MLGCVEMAMGKLYFVLVIVSNQNLCGSTGALTPLDIAGVGKTVMT